MHCLLVYFLFVCAVFLVRLRTVCRAVFVVYWLRIICCLFCFVCCALFVACSYLCVVSLFVVCCESFVSAMPRLLPTEPQV